MKTDIFHHMQSAVDIVGQSLHPTNKIAATIAGIDNNGIPYALSRVNFWPEPIRQKIGINVDIGGASGTVHAETACILSAPKTDNAAIFVTDPPCPNCVKNMAEAGIKTLYIDHKGFDKDFAARRGDDVRDLSLGICEKAGISVYKIFRKEKRTEAIVTIPPDYIPAIDRPARIVKIYGAINFPEIIKIEAEYFDRSNFAVAVCYAPPPEVLRTSSLPPLGGGLGWGGEDSWGGESFIISAEIHPIPGFAADENLDGGKYNHLLQPVHRVMMTAARMGLRINKDYLYATRVPTSREMVNMIGAGIDTITIGDTKSARDSDSMKAMEILQSFQILKVKKYDSLV
jgi:deoxycytidylate deaminase